MQIANNSVVSFHYTLKNAQGDELENNRQDAPSLYLHGANNIITGLENAMAGKSAGDSFEVTLTAEQAYGPRQDNMQQRIPAKYLKHEGKLKVGQPVSFNTDKGKRNGTVIKVGKFSVDIDTNHPLAGQTLLFAIEITDVREATAEEIQHGHAHGVGGHQH